MEERKQAGWGPQDRDVGGIVLVNPREPLGSFRAGPSRLGQLGLPGQRVASVCLAAPRASPTWGARSIWLVGNDRSRGLWPP